MAGGILPFQRQPDRRGSQRSDRRGGPSGSRTPQSPHSSTLTIPPEQITPLTMSENRWVPRAAGANGEHTQDVLEKKVKGLLNKLTLEKFDRLAPQILEYANWSEKEDDAESLRNVIRLVFEKATDEPAFSAMYAQLCGFLPNRMSTTIIDKNIVDKEGRPVVGGHIFRKHLLTRCQVEFEKGWKITEAGGEANNTPAPGTEILTDEYYAAQKKKRRGLGLIRFIGELFKLRMLTEGIMHACVRRLLDEDPEEEEIESLCKLLTTVGKQLDHPDGRPHMDLYFGRMDQLAVHEKLPSRIRYMVQDVIDLRKNAWVPRRDAAGPKTIAQIHKDAARAKEEAAAAAESRRTASSGGRGMPGLNQQMRSGGRKAGGDSDGWKVATNSASRKTGDLSNFGKFSQSTPINLGPGGIFNSQGSKGWQGEKKRDEKSSLSRSSSSHNAFSLLDNSSGRRPSVDASNTASAPSSEPNADNAENSAASEASKRPPTPPSAQQPAKAPKTPKEEKVIIDKMLKEFWGVHDWKIVVDIVSEDIENAETHIDVIEAFVTQSLEKKRQDVDAAKRALDGLQSVVSAKHYRAAFERAVEFLEDVICDAPMAPTFFGELLAASGLPSTDVNAVVEKISPPADEKVKASAVAPK